MSGPYKKVSTPEFRQWNKEFYIRSLKKENVKQDLLAVMQKRGLTFSPIERNPTRRRKRDEDFIDSALHVADLNSGTDCVPDAWVLMSVQGGRSIIGVEISKPNHLYCIRPRPPKA